MVYYHFPYSWVGGLILYIKRPQPENRRFVPMGFFFPICSQTRWGVLHVPSSQPRHRDLMLWPIAHVPWQTVRTSAEICWVDGSENPKATWDGAKILFKKKKQPQVVSWSRISGCHQQYQGPDFEMYYSIWRSYEDCQCQLRFARLLLTLLRRHNGKDYTGNSMHLLPQHRLHARLEQWWKLWRALANCWWNFKYFLEFSPWVFGEDEAILTNIFQRGWFNHQLVHFRKS